MRRPLRQVPWVRPVDQPYRPGRRVSPVRTPGVWTWRASKVERMEAWLDNHPAIESLLGALLVALFLGVLAYLVWCVPEAVR